jgi:hypothetical protein
MDMHPPGGSDRPEPQLMEMAREGMQAVLARSAVDLDFRRELLADPRQALARHFGWRLPAGFDVAFVENRAGATIVLPDFVGGTRHPAPGTPAEDGGEAA